jgi:hypothetical protein
MNCGFPERHRATGVRLRHSCRMADGGSNGELRRDDPACGGHPAPARAGCTNKPNLPAGSGPGVEKRACDHAKQSQTWASWGIWGTARQGSLLCETKPIRRRGQVGRGPRGVGRRAIVRNKPNLPTARDQAWGDRGRRASRTNKANLPPRRREDHRQGRRP